MNKMKKNIAIVAGGDQSEVVVSLKSAAGLSSFIPSEKYNIYVVVIQASSWKVQLNDDVEIPIDKNDFSFVLNGEKITFDCAYITIHGIPGEDGRLQGYFEMIGMPYTCCDVLAAALTYNKFTCNHYLKGFGVNVAESIMLRKGQTIESKEAVNQLGLPIFVKPNVGGSSFGVTKVKSEEEIQQAVEKAFAEGDQVILESYMKGTEITCGMYKTKEKTVVFPITEVVSENEFFDFDAKYNDPDGAQLLIPAELSENDLEKIRKTAMAAYKTLDATGLARVDLIIDKGSNEVYLNEINTIPGIT